MEALEIAGRLTTRELAVKLRADREQVYKCCKRLEKDGRLTSELVETGEKNIYFFPMTREVVTAENHEHIEHLNEAVAGTIRAHALPQERDQLVAALELQFERLAERLDGSNRGALEEFADELIDAAGRAHKRGDVMGHLGIRPMRPPARLWALGRQLSLN